MANKITTILDLDGRGFDKSIKNIRKSVADADGALNKFKAGSTAAFDSLKGYGTEAAFAAGAALVAFGVKSVNAFNDLAISSGKLAEALGMPVEDASRLVEVAGDIGIEMGALESTIGKMNVTAAKTPQAFAAIGAEIVKNADGTTNVNETFLATVDALNKMPDATQRAAAAQKIFGKGWRDIAELVGQGSDDIRKSLEGVSDAKIIDEDEVAKAREYRAAMDNLGDAFQDAALIAGEVLTPAVTDAVDALLGLKNATVQANESSGGLLRTVAGATTKVWELTTPVAIAVNFFKRFADETDAGTTAFLGRAYAMQSQSRTTEELTETTEEAAAAQADLADAYSQMEAGVRAANEALAESIELALEAAGSAFDLESATLDVANAAADLATKQSDVNDVLSDGASTDAEKSAALRDLRASQIDTAGSALELAQAYALEQGAAEGSQESINAQVDALSMLKGQYPEIAGEIQLMIDKMLGVPGVVDTKLTADTLDANRSLDQLQGRLNAMGSTATSVSVVAANRFRQYARGTSNHPGGLAIVGEEGPELVDLPAGSAVSTASETSAMLSGGGASTVARPAMSSGNTINVYTNADPQAVVEAIRQWERRNGRLY